MCCSTLVSQFRLRNEFIKCNFIKRTWREEKKKRKEGGKESWFMQVRVSREYRRVLKTRRRTWLRRVINNSIISRMYLE